LAEARRTLASSVAPARVQDARAMLYPALLLPAALFAWAYWRFVKRRNIWRDGAVLCLFLLFGYPALPRRTSAVDAVIVADRSASIDPQSRARQREMIGYIERNLSSGDRMTVVSFGEGARLEGFFQAGENFRDFQDDRAEDASALDEGLKLAQEVADFSQRNVRFVILSDGEYTGLDPVGRARRVAESGGVVHYRHLEAPPAFRSGRSRWPSAQQGLRPRALPPELRSLRQRGCRGGLPRLARWQAAAAARRRRRGPPTSTLSGGL
jgi:hypothetical protein